VGEVSISIPALETMITNMPAAAAQPVGQTRPDAAAASIVAAYMPDVLQIVSGRRRPGADRFGHGIQDDGVGLGVSAQMFGLALRAIGTNTNNTATVVQGWIDQLPAHLRDVLSPRGTTPSAADIHNFLQDPGRHVSGSGSILPGGALFNAAMGLDFLSDNLAASWDSIDAPKTRAMQIMNDVRQTGVGDPSNPPNLDAKSTDRTVALP